jgi:RNA polymerase sigma factor (sigma-70 family)
VDLEYHHIQQVIDGDAASFSYLVTRYKELAFAIAIRILENEQDAEEAVQDAFVQAFRKIRNFRGESRFSTWLYRIVVNHSLTRARKRKRVLPYADLELAEGQFEAIENCYSRLTGQDQTKYINLALERLAPEDRILLTLYYLEEQSIGEIAEITGISRENTKMKLHRARRKMYGVLSKLLGTELNPMKDDQ